MNRKELEKMIRSPVGIHQVDFKLDKGFGESAIVVSTEDRPDYAEILARELVKTKQPVIRIRQLMEIGHPPQIWYRDI